MVQQLSGTRAEVKYAHSFKGCGKLPENLSSAMEIRTTTLLNNVPRLINGYINTYRDSQNYKAVFVVVTDNDRRQCAEFKAQIIHAINSQSLIPIEDAIVCLAIEEMEAWLLGDFEAIKSAYPHANKREHISYVQDSICGTWEKLARVIDEKLFEKKLKNASFYTVGEKKSEWARNITSYFNVQNNLSPSFNYFIKKIMNYIK